MKTPMRRGVVGALLLAAWLCTIPSSSLLSAQDSNAKRRLVQQSATPYPALARNMALQGVAKLDVLVAPDGSVKEIAIKGGHPILAQAAANAVRRWRWEPAAHDSHEPVEVKFSPND
jgi:TonB family protein